MENLWLFERLYNADAGPCFEPYAGFSGIGFKLRQLDRLDAHCLLRFASSNGLRSVAVLVLCEQESEERDHTRDREGQERYKHCDLHLHQNPTQNWSNNRANPSQP